MPEAASPHSITFLLNPADPAQTPAHAHGMKTTQGYIVAEPGMVACPPPPRKRDAFRDSSHRDNSRKGREQAPELKLELEAPLKPVSSYCHICSLFAPKFVACSNSHCSRRSRKVVCDRCIRKRGLQPDRLREDDNWQCTHCTNVRCFASCRLRGPFLRREALWSSETNQ